MLLSLKMTPQISASATVLGDGRLCFILLFTSLYSGKLLCGLEAGVKHVHDCTTAVPLY